MLKPCPFCGSDNLVMEHDSDSLCSPIMFWVQCNSCNCDVEAQESEQKAIEAWNNRPIENELIEALEKAKDFALDLEYRGYAKKFSTAPLVNVINNAISKAKGEVK